MPGYAALRRQAMKIKIPIRMLRWQADPLQGVARQYASPKRAKSKPRRGRAAFGGVNLERWRMRKHGPQARRNRRGLALLVGHGPGRAGNEPRRGRAALGGRQPGTVVGAETRPPSPPLRTGQRLSPVTDRRYSTERPPHGPGCAGPVWVAHVWHVLDNPYLQSCAPGSYIDPAR